MCHSPVLNTRRLLLAAVSLAVLFAAPSSSRAQARAETEAATQELGSDPDVAVWDVALTTNVLSPVFGSYGARVEVAPAAWLSLAVSPAWLSATNATGLELTVSAHVWPLAAGLDGPFVGPHLRGARVEINGAASAVLGVGAEVGWQIVWGGLAVAMSGEVGWETRTDSGDANLSLGARLALGWAWR